MMNKKIEEKARGANYEKLRKSKIKPPSFITSPRQTKTKRINKEIQIKQEIQKKGKVIFNAHISITPTR